MHEAQNLVFGSFRLDVGNQQLWKDTRQIKLRPTALATLRYLATRPGQLVTKATLQHEVWNGRVISESVQKVCINAIRKALEDNARSPQFVETVHGQGYRFIAPVHTHYAAPGMVGRSVELAYLEQKLKLALAGERQLIFVSGEAGIGKTTLVKGFLDRLRTEEQLWVGRGQCVEQYGKGESYLPVLEALGQLCRGVEGARFLNILCQYAPTWALQLPGFLDDIVVETVQRRAQGATQERMLREFAEAIEILTSERGLILWLEDIHASDPSTLDLLAYLAQRMERARLMVIGTYRLAEVIVGVPRLKAIKQELQARRQCEEIQLELLNRQAVAEYIAQRCGEKPLAEDLVEFVYQHTEGNALFMVHLVDYVIEQGLVVEEKGQWTLRGEHPTIGIPDSVRQLIEKQIEELSDEEQQVLESASITGETFTVAAVAAAVKSTEKEVEIICERLARRGRFLHEREVEQWPDWTVTGSYGFVHTLYHNVLYSRVAAARRLRLHRVVGERKERAYRERGSEIAAELATHFERGQDYHRAVQYYWQAGEMALRRSAYREALDHFTKGLELLLSLPETPERTQQELLLQVALGVPVLMLKGFGTEDIGTVFMRAQELSQQFGDTAQLFQTTLGLWTSYLVRGELQTAQRLAEQLMHLGQSGNEPTLLLRAHNIVGVTLYFCGELTSARAHLEQGLSFSLEPDLHQPQALLGVQAALVTCRICLAWVLWALGYPTQAIDRSEEALSLAHEASLPFLEAMALDFAAFVHSLRREGQRAWERAEAAIRCATEYGFTFWVEVGRLLQGWALTQHGDRKEGVHLLRHGLETWRARGTELTRPYYLARLAEACGEIEQPEEGLAMVADALELIHKTGERWYAAELYRLKGQLTLQSTIESHRGRGKKSQKARSQNLAAEAEACFQQAIDIARRQQAKSLELRATVSLSRLWQMQGKKTAARQQLREIYQWFTEGFDTEDLKEAKALLEELQGSLASEAHKHAR